MAFLEIAAGPEAGRRYELHPPGPIKMGRHPNCGIVIQVGAVSREHAEIESENGSFYVRDLQSRNGTYLNDQLLEDRMLLHAGDRVRVCDVTFAFHTDAKAPREAPVPKETERPFETAQFSPDDKAVLVDDESSGSTIMSKLDVSSGTSGVQVTASPEAKLAALLEITQSLGNAMRMEEVLPGVLNSLFKIFVQADRGFIVLKTHDGNLAPRWTKTRRENDDTIRISRTIVSQVMESKEAILSADAASDERFEMSQSLADFRIRSMMCAPLINSDGEALGVLQIDTLDQRKRFEPEDLQVLASVAVQAGIAVNNAQMHEAALQRKELERDLVLANEVQKSFLPVSSPKIEGYEFYNYYQPANFVGGDYYDYIPLRDGRIAVIVADVVGHGVAAALLMAKMSAEARICLAQEESPGAAVTRLNNTISSLDLDKFITMIMVVVDPEKHEATIVNAGHMPPIILRSDGAMEEPGEEEAGLPVGVMEDVEYEQVVVAIGPGDSFTMYTDGLNEAMKTTFDDQGQEQVDQYGMDRIREHIRRGGGLKDTGEAIIRDIRIYVGDAPQDDDMCLVRFKRL